MSNVRRRSLPLKHQPMNSEMQMPQATRFPSLRLILPPLIPLSFLLVLLAGVLLGHEWNAHGTGLLLAVLAQVTALIGAVIELFALNTAIAWLRANASARTKANVFCTAFAATFVAAVGLWLLIALVFGR